MLGRARPKAADKVAKNPPSALRRFLPQGLWGCAAVVVGLSAVCTMGDEPQQGGGQRPPVESRPGGLQREVERPGPGPRPQLAGQIVDLEGVNEPVNVEMSDTVRITGRGIAGAQIAIDVKGVGKLIAANNVRKVKDGLGFPARAFAILP